MSMLKEKLKGVIDSISDALKSSATAIEQIIKENQQYLNAELNVVKESIEGIVALKKYAETETPSLKTAVSTLAESYEKLEEARKEKVEKLKAEFIAPLQNLVISFKQQQQQLKEAANAKKDLEKAEKKLDNEKSKPEEKQSPEKIKEAESFLEEAKKTYKKVESETKIATDKFNTEKLGTLKKVLTNIVNVEKEFHQSMLNTMSKLEEKISGIK